MGKVEFFWGEDLTFCFIRGQSERSNLIANVPVDADP